MKVENQVVDLVQKVMDEVEVEDEAQRDKLENELLDEIMATIEIFLSEHKKARA